MSTLNIKTPPAEAETPEELLRKQVTIKPDIPFGDIALAMSGGGFRAAAFSLGALSYLNRAWLADEDDTLLRHISFTTSTSGGSLTNAFYCTSVFKPGFSFDKFYQDTKSFMDGEKLIMRVSDILTDEKRWNEVGEQNIDGEIKKIPKSHNLINAFAKAYDELLFKNNGQSETLDLFFDRSANPHLKTVCFNTTELNNGVAFRFQTNGDPSSIFTVGNYYLHFKNADVARKIKVSDISATSSCFPSGFEPMIYPRDYVHAGLTDIDEMLTAISYDNNNPLKLNDVANKPFALMDGGIVDNQGLESMMSEDNFRAAHPDKKPFDLMMVCDVSSYFMDRFEPVEEPKGGLNAFTLKNVSRWIFGISLAGILLCAGLLFIPNCTANIIGLLLLLPFLMLGLGYWYINHYVSTKLDKLNDTHFGRTILRYLGYFGSLTFGVLQQMIMARVKSILMLNLSIFLAQERRMSYNSFYNMPVYKNRVLSCFIYEFSFQHDAVRQNNLQNKDKAWWAPNADVLAPSPKLQAMATQATSMATTLWFDAGIQTMRDAVIACGQFTMCYNLLKRIYRLELMDEQWKTDKNLQALKTRLLADWALFNANPDFMV
jgi:predicted acylesterase/phospholipase RssA